MDRPDPTTDHDELLGQLGWMRTLARRLTRDPDVADDVLQGACLLALQRPPEPLGGVRGLRAWTAAVLRRMASDRRREQARREAREQVAAAREELPATVDLAARREILRALVDALTTLEEPGFSTVVRRYYEGLSTLQIASQDGVSPEVVRQRLQRARARLRERLTTTLDPRWLPALALLSPRIGDVAGQVAGAAPQGASLPQPLLRGLLMAERTTRPLVWKAAAAATITLALGSGTWLLVRARHDDAPATSMTRVPRITDAAPVSGSTELPSVGAREAESLAAGTQGTPTTQASATTPEPATFATIGAPYVLSGRVVDPSGLPVAGAEIRHRPSPATLAAVGMQHQPFVGAERFPWDELPRTSTDARGRFTFTVRELPRQDQPGRNELRRGGGSFAPPVVNVPSVVVLAAGFGAKHYICFNFASADLDVGDIVLAPGAGLTGRVVDEQGGMLGGVRVSLCPGAESPDSEHIAEWLAVAQAFDIVTGDEGRFRLDSLWPGKLPLRFELPGFAPLDRDFDLAANAIEEAGDIALIRGGRIEGVVLDVDRRPLVGARVKARFSYGNVFGVGGDSVTWEMQIRTMGRNQHEVETTSGEGGVFAVETLNHPTYDLFVAASGHEPIKMPQVATGTRDLVIVLTEEASALMTVVDATSGAPVVDATATAARHSAADAADARSQQSRVEVLAGAEAASAVDGNLAPDGLLLLRGLGSQRNTVLVSAPGYGSSEFELPGIQAPERITRTLELPREAVVAGRVVDEDGAPVAGAKAALEPATGTLSPQETADAEGRFRLGALAAGDWKLQVSQSGCVPSELLALTLVSGEVHDVGEILLARGGRVTGLVVDADGRAAVAATVGAERLAPATPGIAGRSAGQRRTSLSVVTGPEGRFAFEALAAGRYSVTCDPGAAAEVEVVGGADTDVALQLRRRPRVHGRVTDSAGPVADAEVFGQFKMALGFIDDSQARSSASGTYELEFYAPGTYRVRAVTGGEATPAHTVDLQWGDDLVVDLPFGGERLEGLVVAAEGDAPIAGARIRLMNLTPSAGAEDDAPRQFQVETDTEGRFEARRLLPGPHRVEAGQTGFATASLGPLDVPRPAGAAPLRFELNPEATVSGVVKTLAGTAVPKEIKVVVVGEGVAALVGSPLELVLGIALDGAYRGDGLASGSYRVQVRRRTNAPGEPVEWQLLTEQRVTLTAGKAAVVDFLISP